MTDVNLCVKKTKKAQPQAANGESVIQMYSFISRLTAKKTGKDHLKTIDAALDACTS